MTKLKTRAELEAIIDNFSPSDFLNPTYGFDQCAVINCVTGEIRVEERTHSTHTRYSDDNVCAIFSSVKWESIKDFLYDVENYYYFAEQLRSEGYRQKKNEDDRDFCDRICAKHPDLNLKEEYIENDKTCWAHNFEIDLDEYFYVQYQEIVNRYDDDDDDNS